MNGRPVISGVSGRFSNCSNVNQLRDRLYQGVDMTFENEERWPKGIFGLPSKSGVLLDFENFDASFFGFTDEEADLIDPSTRFNIEVTFEALCDAGLNPWNLGKRKVTLFQAQTNNEMDNNSIANDKEQSSGPQMVERLLAYVFNVKNGAFLYETACSSSFTALNEAFVQLTHGCIDLAIVSCANVMWTPSVALSYHRLGLTSQNGNCKFLDANASGYGRSETTVCLIIERACDAQRIHGELVFSMTNSDGYKPQGITYPSWESQASLLHKFYKKANIDPAQLEYVECHGTGTEVGDMVETKSLWSVFGDGRSKLPLLLGSIKTNLGHSEAGSGLSSLVKCLIILKMNAIPPNIHYEQPSPHIPELQKGFVAPVLKVTPFNGDYIPVNNFGFGGANGHIIIGRTAKKDQKPTKDKPLLLLCCGRTEISLQTMINGITSIEKSKITPHFAHFVNRYSYHMSSAITPDRMMKHRSYIIAFNNYIESFKISPLNELPPYTQVPICFAFPGAGCQMDYMIQPFMSLKPFRESIEDSLAIIDPNGIKGVRETLFNARQSHWKIFAFGIFQIAVVDTLKAIGIVPDIIVGHSFGEYCCAYADGVLSKAEILDICFTIAQVITSIISESKTFKSCSMISVTLPWNKLSPLIPSNLYPACFNTQDNITLAGYTEDIVQFSNHLKVQNIFHRLIDSCGFGFHTQALGKIVDHLREKFAHYSNVYRQRSNRWIISHESSMNTDQLLNIQTLAVEIIANVVKFENACHSIPNNAICIEIAPRKFLTSLLKCNLTEALIVEVPFKVGNLQFVQIDHNNHIVNHHNHQPCYPQFPDSFLHSLGNLYINGCPINLEPILSDQLDGPAPYDTPFLSPLIKLDHSVPHLVRRFPEYYNYNCSSQEKITLDVNQKGKYYLGCFHYNGHRVIPIAALIHSVWSKFASRTARNTNDLAVCLERIKLYRPVLFSDAASVSILFKFLPTIQEKFKFIVTTYADNLIIMTGFISVFDDYNGTNNNNDGSETDIDDNDDSNSFTIERNIFYGILSRNGIHYQDELRNVIEVNGNTSRGKMINNHDWAVRFESLLQFVSLSKNQGKPSLSCVTNNIAIRLDEIHCIPDESSSSFEDSTVTMIYDKFLDTIRSKSIYIRGIHLGSFRSQLSTKLIPLVPQIETFIPRFNRMIRQPLKTALTIIVDHLIEFTNRHPNQQSQSITLITTTSPCKSIKIRNEMQSLGDLIANELNQRKAAPCDWIKIDSLNQLTNRNISKLDDNRLDGNSGPSNNHLLILETDNNNLIDLISGPVISPSNFDYLIVHQTMSINNHEDNICSSKLIKHLQSYGLVIVSNTLSDQGYLYLIRWSIDLKLFNLIEINSSFQSLIANLHKINDNQQQLHWLMVNNLSSSIGLIDSMQIDNQMKQQTIQLKWLINETDDDGNDSKHCFDDYIPIGLTYTVLRNGVQGSYHYLPINLSSTSPSSPPSSSTIETTNHVDNKFLIQLLSPSQYDTSIVICCNQIPDCTSIIGYAKVTENCGEIGIIKHNQAKDDYLIIHRWNYNPKIWSLEEAATIPVPYSLAYYGLIVIGRLLRGESVLIVNGHSPIGCAVLTICLSLSCTIYLTVETEDQKVSLVNRFPSLTGEQFLITTNSDQIEQTITILTNGCGCDLVVNTMAIPNDNNITTETTTGNNQVKGNNIEFMLKCLSIGGRCVDLNKSPMSVDSDLGLAIFLKNIAYYSATPDGLFQSMPPPPSNTENTTGKSNHPHHRIADLLAKEIISGVICPLVGVDDSVEMIKIEPKKRLIQDNTQSTKLPLVNLIIGQAGDIELEIIEKSRLYDKVSQCILIPISSSSNHMTFSPSSSTKESLSSSSINLSDLSILSSSSSSYSFPLTPNSSTNHQQSLTLKPTLTPPSSSSSPSSTNKPPKASNYHPYIINQLGLLDCSFIDISESTINGESFDKNSIKNYQQVLKDISRSYTINKVFLVYRSSHPDNQHSNHYYHSNHHQPQHILHHHNNFENQLMIELLDYVTNPSQISINFLTLISCSLTKDYTFIWPQLVRKCQQYGERYGITSNTVNLTDLLSSDDPNYWSQLDQYISQLYCQIIGINDNDNDDNKKDNHHNSNRKVNGVYKLTCKVDNQ